MKTEDEIKEELAKLELDSKNRDLKGLPHLVMGIFAMKTILEWVLDK